MAALSPTSADPWPRDIPRTCSYPMLIKAVQAWAQGDTDAQLAEYLGCRITAVPRYKETEGWNRMVRRLRHSLDFDFETVFGRLGFMALRQLEDRMRYGDHYTTRTGEQGRRPLSADQLAKIAASLVDRRGEMRHLVDGTVSQAQQEKRSDLAMIAEALRLHASKEVSVVPAVISSPQPMPVIDLEAAE